MDQTDQLPFWVTLLANGAAWIVLVFVLQQYVKGRKEHEDKTNAKFAYLKDKQIGIEKDIEYLQKERYEIKELEFIARKAKSDVNAAHQKIRTIESKSDKPKLVNVEFELIEIDK